ncbi:hypothetical protein TREMEDRAFT_59651 [Tremella mesenterica DSM 1558]|uniref:uncharacterized protein n=1 Tax=Tremella mesenterica (strain ATCC 24925 / CBS 8224 / DSM 1558 / NBRC 9311 / NRRL Y-6157 / RJB 2259-6 / UBC 559-6) TaxID=578456 RepID=UPI0003F48E60|nr:uncharacterized protein TREMEDRAFT_59651 [Tremella mesenterica DSM 1558]XP_007005476.1 uncharacterized protein TREMEDRAFT_63239 [Tremella mesenterica DSM 1558]EIW68780.1 hypothetical protein TREMEDRAFT_63239 [Tremella mesenterica DSM 1558]EIW73478.1 hypothetical protein TREMEDRAFT_59651 [Tremella mesenterica DSM 1558]
MSKRTLSSSTPSRQTRASTLATLPDVDPELLMRQTKRMRITSQAASSQPPLVDASRRALDTIKEKYQSGPSREAQSFLDDHVIEQYFDFEGGAGPSATGENLSPAKSVESEHPTVVENANSPGKQLTGPPSEASDELVEVPDELGGIFHAPRKVPVNKELVKLLEDRKDSEIATLWAGMTFSSVRLALKNEALGRFRETNAIKPTVKWFKNALDRLAQGWRLRNKNGAVVRLEGELCTDCQRRLDGGEDFRVGCIGPLGGVCGECSAKGTSKCSVKTNNPESKFREVPVYFLRTWSMLMYRVSLWEQELSLPRLPLYWSTNFVRLRSVIDPFLPMTNPPV